ncbi:MAG: hypothetical protein PVJ39_09095 [Gammaproteobacteria bacterium]|jgi:hypothetical protein
MKIRYLIYFWAFCFFSNPAHSDITTKDWKQLAMVEGVIGTSSYVFANNPEGWGTAFIVTSPFLAAMAQEGESSWPSYILGIGIIGGIGAWLVSKDGEPKADITKQLILGYNALFLPLWAYSKWNDDTPKTEPQSYSMHINPGTKQLLVQYAIHF